MFKRFVLASVAAGSAVVMLVPPAATAAPPCKSHEVSYLAQGTYQSSSVPLASSTSWSGSLTIKLKSANHQFKQANNLTVKKTAKGTMYTYTVSNASVHFGQGVDSPATVGDHVTVGGTATEYSSACTSTTPTITIQSISVSS